MIQEVLRGREWPLSFQSVLLKVFHRRITVMTVVSCHCHVQLSEGLMAHYHKKQSHNTVVSLSYLCD